MTGIAIGAVRTGRTLTEAEREVRLRWLTGAWEDYAGDVGPQELASLAHPSLRSDQRTVLAESYAELRELASDLRDGVKMPREVYPELTIACGDAQQAAIDITQQDAADVLAVLKNGTGES